MSSEIAALTLLYRLQFPFHIIRIRICKVLGTNIRGSEDVEQPHRSYSHLNLMFLTIINKENCFLALLDTINSHFHFALPSFRGIIVNSFL